jgi:hypothetical protein
MVDKEDTFDEQLSWRKLHVQPSINQLIIQVTISMLKNMVELFVFTNFTLYKLLQNNNTSFMCRYA